MKIYTRTGDKGTTALFGGSRHSKSKAIFEVLGSLDELNAHLGFAAASKNKIISKTVVAIQNDLFQIGAWIADKRQLTKKTSQIAELVTNFESTMDELDKTLPSLTNFILPGGTQDSLHLHLARTVCRRLERQMVKNISDYNKNGLLKYINRLSDLLFVLARYSNFKAKVKDTIWEQRK